MPYVATVTMQGPTEAETPRFRGGLSRIRLADGSQLVTASLAEGSPEPRWPGGEQGGTPLLRVDSTGAFRTLVGWRPASTCTVPFDAGAGMGSGFLGIPFCPVTLDDASVDGSRISIQYVEPGPRPAYHVSVIRLSGDTIFNRTYPYRPEAIPASARDSARAARTRGSASMREAAAQMKIPEVYPPVARLLSGRDETTWLETTTRGATRRWIVLDAGGSEIGRLEVPGNIRIMVASRASVWAIETDGDGLESVVRFRVSR